MRANDRITALASALEELIKACDWIENNYLPFEKLSGPLSNAKYEIMRYYALCDNRKPL